MPVFGNNTHKIISAIERIRCAEILQDILGGTARNAAMGGAFCAVGGDLSH